MAEVISSERARNAGGTPSRARLLDVRCVPRRRGALARAASAASLGRHHLVAAAVPSHATPAACGVPVLYAKTGRFSTESKNGGLLVDENGMHLNVVGPQGSVDRGEKAALQHRYQVGMLRAFATGGA